MLHNLHNTGENPDDVKVVKTAPTGKAAFNIKGNTLHAAFKIPANRGFEYCALDNDRLNTIRTQLKKLKMQHFMLWCTCSMETT